MFERFTDRARKVVVLAQEEARMLNHNYIGGEHLLLGLIHEGHGVAAKALERLGLSLDSVREQTEEVIGQGAGAPTGHIPFTPRAKRVLELSLREALQIGHNYIGTEHILLGILREGENVGAQVLVRMGTNLNQVRLEVIKLVAPEAGAEATSPGESGRPPREVRMARSAARYDLLLTELRNSLASVTERLTAIERHLGLPGRADVPGGPLGDKPGNAAEPAESADKPGEPEEPEEPGESAGKPEEPPGDVTAGGE